MTSAGHGTNSAEKHHHGTGVYWKVGAVLAVITALEVGVVYVEALAAVLAVLLILLGMAKFVLVAWYFMHLNIDSKVYTGFFAAGFLVAVATFVALLAMAGSIGAEALGGA